MSEQAKRAEDLAYEMRWQFTSGSTERAIEMLKAALQAAERRGVEAGREEMYSALAECVRSLRRMRLGTKAELLKLLDALHSRLLSEKEGPK